MPDFTCHYCHQKPENPEIWLFQYGKNWNITLYFCQTKCFDNWTAERLAQAPIICQTCKSLISDIDVHPMRATCNKHYY